MFRLEDVEKLICINSNKDTSLTGTAQIKMVQILYSEQLRKQF